MAFKSLLLDVNGVVLRDPDLLHHVKENHVAYVASKVPYSKDPRNTEKLLYKGFGSTLNGLKTVYGVDTSDFEEKVYDKKLMDRLAETLYSTEFQRDAKIIYNIAKGHEWKVTLVSNAPNIWSARVADAIGDVYTRCKSDHVSWPQHHLHIYVDNSLTKINLKRFLPNWSPVLFTGTKQSGTWYKQVRSFEDLALYINSLDMWIAHNHWHLTEY